MIRFSIITPVYNSKPFLKRCISSVQKQEVKNWELLMINDGSIDGSDLELKKFSDLDARIHVFHQENQGAFAARRLGISYAMGEYILFLDSDDELAENCLKEMDEALRRTNADILFYMCSVIEKGKKTQRFLGSCGPNECILSTRKLLQRVLFSNDLNSLCTKAFRRPLLTENTSAYRYKNKMVGCVGEDKIQLLYPLLFAKKIVFTPCVWYYYHHRECSTMHDYNVNKISQMMAEEMFEWIREFMKDVGLSDRENMEKLDRYYLKHCLSVYFSTRKNCRSLQAYFAFRHYPWEPKLQYSIWYYLFHGKLSMKEIGQICMIKLRL